MSWLAQQEVLVVYPHFGETGNVFIAPTFVSQDLIDELPGDHDVVEQ